MSISIKDDEIIIARCTPGGSGALALLRLSGPNTRSVVKGFSKFPAKKSINDLISGTVHFGWVTTEDNRHIDQVMFIIMDGPKTFTGQDTIEITCHNNPFIVQAIIDRAIACGARLAQEGEFTRRAYQNGKIDLLQAEAINELIHANTQHALKQSLAQLEGSFSQALNGIQSELIRTLAWCEASFEFLDEEEEFGDRMNQHLAEIITRINQIKKSFNAQQQIRNGIRVALIGSVNAGKSSLFNTLLEKNRAIVSDIPGTTRDVIESGMERNGNYITLCDTAGLRQTNDIIEQEGIKRSFEEAQRADIIFLVYDQSRSLTIEETEIYQQIANQFKDKIISVANKSDMPQVNKFPTHTLPFSSKTRMGLLEIEMALDKRISQLFSHLESPYLLNQRHFNLLKTLEDKLHIVQNMLVSTPQYELISIHIKDALEDISQLTGKTISEAGLDMVF